MRLHLKPVKLESVGPPGAVTPGRNLQLRQITRGWPDRPRVGGLCPGSPYHPHHSPERSRDRLLITETPGAEQAPSPLDQPVQTEASSTQSPNRHQYWAGMFAESTAVSSQGLGTEDRETRQAGNPGKELFPNWKVQWGEAVGGGQCPLGPHQASVLAATARLFFLIEV